MISTSQFSWPDRADDQFGGELAVDIDAHHRTAEIGGVEFARAVQAAFLADGEEQRDRRMRELVLDKRFGNHDQKRDAGAGVAAERGRAVRNDAVAFAPGFGARAERHGVEMGGEQQARAGPRSRKIDD